MLGQVKTRELEAARGKEENSGGWGATGSGWWAQYVRFGLGLAGDCNQRVPVPVWPGRAVQWAVQK